MASPLTAQSAGTAAPQPPAATATTAKSPSSKTATSKSKSKTGKSKSAASKTAHKKKGKAAKDSAKTRGASRPADTTQPVSDTPAAKSSGTATKRSKTSASRALRSARTAKIKQAFVASTELRPMAQQLGALRTPAAYAGVASYAHSHTGEAAAAAYLALGHAYLLDNHYPEAASNFRLARQAGEALADYADFLAARALHSGGNQTAAEELLRGFASRYPDSIFASQVPELEANVQIGMNDPASAQRILAAAAGTPAASHPGFELAEAQVAAALGQTSQAIELFKHLLLSHPLSSEAELARAKLTALGAESSLTVAELRSLGDAYYNAGRYEAAGEQFRSLARSAKLDEAAHNGFAVAAAACDLKLKRLTAAQAEALADTPDENGARRLYLLMELARTRDDQDEQKRIVTRMEADFGQSQWLAEALKSSGDMYMLKRDYAPAVEYYTALATRFPNHKYASAVHWRATWLSYRQGLYADAARMCDEQIRSFSGSKETAAALYWRGRLYEAQDHDTSRAAANYRTILRVYQHFFYAQMARERLAALGNAPAAPQPQLDQIQPPPVPTLNESFPTDSPHLAKARLLANAGLNDYIAQEIAADPDSASWSALAEAQIFASYGETYRAMRSLKRALPTAASASISSIPLAYWRILFPQPWWSTIQAESAKNNLDPYLVASLIRQESEFNPGAVSHANAWGLMQLLPSVGKQMAREEGNPHFETFHLLDPETNIRLGTRYLHKTLDHFGGVVEYTLAAYDAGDDRVADWEAAGPYSGIDEFVESIPFTETRDYVEAILRNRETYRAIDEYARSHGAVAAR
jgi:soluble lytic murein transglycosylase